MTRLLNCLLTALFLFCFSSTAMAQTIAAKTAYLQKIDGYVPLYWDAANGKMWMEIARFNAELLYQTSLPAGIGSNPIGLDRGQLGSTSIVQFERVGPKVLMIQPNYRYRALSNDEAERRAVADSFARSVLWGFKVEASEGDKVLVDATSFFLRDAHGVAERFFFVRAGKTSRLRAFQDVVNLRERVRHRFKRVFGLGIFGCRQLQNLCCQITNMFGVEGQVTAHGDCSGSLLSIVSQENRNFRFMPLCPDDHTDGERTAEAEDQETNCIEHALKSIHCVCVRVSGSPSRHRQPGSG